MKRVLVTGGAGFIGSHIVDKLIQNGYDVVVFDNLDPQVHNKGEIPDYLSKKITFINGDVTNKQQFYDALSQDIDVVYHEAAAVGVGQSMYEISHYMNTNAMGTAHLLNFIANEKHTIKKIIVAASMSSYGEGMYSCPTCGTVRPLLRTTEDIASGKWEPVCPSCKGEIKPIPTTEDAVQYANSIYAIGKKLQEDMIMNIAQAYNIPAVALRYFNVYGPRQSLSNPYTGVAAIFMSRIKAGNAPVIYEDGLQTRDFISVYDIAEANLRAMESDNANYQRLNVGSGIPLTIRSIAETLASIFGREDLKPEIKYTFRKGDVRHCYADLSKTKQLLDWEPKISFEKGMRDYIEWARTQESVDMFDKAAQELKDKKLL